MKVFCYSVKLLLAHFLMYHLIFSVCASNLKKEAVWSVLGRMDNLCSVLPTNLLLFFQQCVLPVMKVLGLCLNFDSISHINDFDNFCFPVLLNFVQSAVKRRNISVIQFSVVQIVLKGRWYCTDYHKHHHSRFMRFNILRCSS